MSKEIIDVLRDIVADRELKVKTVEPDIELFGELDSLDIVELIMDIEESYDIEVTDEEAEKWRTFGDVVSYISSKTGDW